MKPERLQEYSLTIVLPVKHLPGRAILVSGLSKTGDQHEISDCIREAIPNPELQLHWQQPFLKGGIRLCGSNIDLKILILKIPNFKEEPDGFFDLNPLVGLFKESVEFPIEVRRGLEDNYAPC